MFVRKCVALGVLAGLAVPGAAFAEDAGFYAGAGIGYSRQKSGEFEGNDTAFKLFGGWKFNEYFAVEGGYIDAGTQSDTLGALDVDLSSDGFFVEGIASLPLGKVVAPYVKAGYVFYDVTTKLSANGQSVSDSESDADFIYGIGCDFRLGGNFALRAEYEKVNLPDSAFDLFSVGAMYRF